MIRFHRKHALRGHWFFAAIMFGAFCLVPGLGWAQHPSGMSLNLYIFNSMPKNEPVYDMHDPADKIGLIGVIKNEIEWPINTNVGVKEIELEQYLIATDPYGIKHMAVQEAKAPEDMLPSSSWGDLETVPAEVIQPGYERSVQIDDLRALFPAMKQIPGEWKIQSKITLSRFLYTVTTQNGIRGVDDRAWNGTLESNQLRVFIVPENGARLRIRVEDLSKPEIKAQHQVQVRVYKGSEIEAGNLTLGEVWNKLEPLARGKTDQGGWVTLPIGASCLPTPAPGDAYIAIAEYNGNFKEAVFKHDAAGWASKCSGRLERYIFFGERVKDFSVFGLNSVLLRNNARIESGNLGVAKICDPCLNSYFEMVLDGGAWVGDSLILMANRVHIESDASVWDVNTNVLEGGGTIRGQVTTPLDLPVWEHLPEFDPVVGNLVRDIVVESQDSRVLAPADDYKDIIVGAHATLNLSPGRYQVRNLILGAQAKIICNGEKGERITIRVAESIVSGSAKASYIGPAADAALMPQDIVIYIAGSPDAVILGQGNRLQANVYAPFGNFTSGEGCILEGSFIAKNIVIGQKSIVNYDGAFASDSGETPTQNSPPSAEFSYATDDLTVTFIDNSTDADGSVISWNWEFGDGGISLDPNPIHSYPSYGTYTVTLEVIDNDGDLSEPYHESIMLPNTGDGILLWAATRKAGANCYVDLNWNGAIGSNVDIYRKGVKRITTPNDGEYTDVDKKLTGSFTYQVCEEHSTKVCSNKVTIAF